MKMVDRMGKVWGSCPLPISCAENSVEKGIIVNSYMVGMN